MKKNRRFGIRENMSQARYSTLNKDRIKVVKIIHLLENDFLHTSI